jgi:hypothetical protein
MLEPILVSGTTTPTSSGLRVATPRTALRARTSGAPREACRPCGCLEAYCVVALGPIFGHCLLRDRRVRWTDTLLSGAAGMACTDRLLSAIACVSVWTSVSAFGGCSFALAVQHVLGPTRLTLVHSHMNSQCLHGGLEDRPHAPGQDYWAWP